MSRRKIFEDFKNIHKTSSYEEVIEVLHRVYNWLSLNQVDPELNNLKILLNIAEDEEFIDKKTKESQLADFELCLSKCSNNEILEAVFRLDNFIAPFSHILDEPISDFERACIKLMIKAIGEKLGTNFIEGYKTSGQKSLCSFEINRFLEYLKEQNANKDNAIAMLIGWSQAKCDEKLTGKELSIILRYIETLDA